jgi:hypothetical protein
MCSRTATAAAGSLTPEDGQSPVNDGPRCAKYVSIAAIATRRSGTTIRPMPAVASSLPMAAAVFVSIDNGSVKRRAALWCKSRSAAAFKPTG